jgi:hypothetical protein
MVIMAPSEIVENLHKQQTLKEPKLLHFDRELYKWLTAGHCKGKPITLPVITGKAKLLVVKSK